MQRALWQATISGKMVRWYPGNLGDLTECLPPKWLHYLVPGEPASNPMCVDGWEGVTRISSFLCATFYSPWTLRTENAEWMNAQVPPTVKMNRGPLIRVEGGVGSNPQEPQKQVQLPPSTARWERWDQRPQRVAFPLVPQDVCFSDLMYPSPYKLSLGERWDERAVSHCSSMLKCFFT